MTICTSCIIPDSFPGVSLQGGHCNFCRDERYGDTKKSTALTTQIDQVLGQHAGTGQYDCLVPVSGGKDSAYVLYHIVRELGLRPFAVFFDSGFSHPLAVKNVETICRELAVPWSAVRTPHDYRNKVVREAVHMSTVAGRLFCICKNCENNLRSAALNEAEKHQIPCIVWGSTDYEDATDTYHGEQNDQRSFQMSFGHGPAMRQALSFMATTGLPVIRRGFTHIMKFCYYIVRNNLDINAPGGLRRLSPVYQVPFNHGRVKTVYFFNHVPYDPVRQVALLKRELGWRTLAGKDARMDCRLHCLANYAAVQKTGLTADGFTMANLVRAGLMEREDALERERCLRETLVGDCLETLEFLGFPGYRLPPVPEAEYRYFDEASVRLSARD